MLSHGLAWTALAFAICSVAASQLLVKWRFNVLSLDRTSPGSTFEHIRILLADGGLWIAALMVIAGALAWYASITRLPLSQALPIATCTAPLGAIGAHLILGEALNAVQVMSILLIAVGSAGLALAR